MWCRYCYGTDEMGAQIAPNDPNWDVLQERARAARDDPAAWIGMTEIYGDLAGNAGFVARFGVALREVWADGAEIAMQRYIAGT